MVQSSIQASPQDDAEGHCLTRNCLTASQRVGIIRVCLAAPRRYTSLPHKGLPHKRLPQEGLPHCITNDCLTASQGSASLPHKKSVSQGSASLPYEGSASQGCASLLHEGSASLPHEVSSSEGSASLPTTGLPHCLIASRAKAALYVAKARRRGAVSAHSTRSAGHAS